MDLATVVKKYLEASGGFDRPVHLSRLGFPKGETEKIVSDFDEDYQISRYMLLSREGDDVLGAYPIDARVYLINEFEVSHVTFHADIQKLL